jgi:large subunit ribosomal protein L7/L12
MVVAGGAGAAAGADAGAAASDAMNIELTEAGAQKIAVIKVVKEALGLDLKAAKELVEAAPKVIKEGVKMEEAEGLKAKLTEAGAVINFK